MDMGVTKAEINILKLEREIMQANINVKSREIKIMELEDEIQRCRYDIDVAKDSVVKLKHQIEQQKKVVEDSNKPKKEAIKEDKEN